MKWIRKRVLLRWLITLPLLYILYCGLLYFFQTKLIFPAEFAGPPGNRLPTADTEVIELETDEGTTTAWLTPAPGADDQNLAGLVMFFHGNAELIDYQDAIISLYHGLGMHVLMVEYRGYGHSDGTPSEAHIVADSVVVLEELLARSDVDPGKLILHGRSIGGGIAAQVAVQSAPAALIVESTGTSVADMALRYGVPSFLVKSPLQTRQAFKRLNHPILILHGKQDEIFPIEHAYRLEEAGEETTLVLFEATHNTLPSTSEASLYAEAIQTHLLIAGVIDEGQSPE